MQTSGMYEGSQLSGFERDLDRFISLPLHGACFSGRKTSKIQTKGKPCRKTSTSTGNTVVSSQSGSRKKSGAKQVFKSEGKHLTTGLVTRSATSHGNGIEATGSEAKNLHSVNKSSHGGRQTHLTSMPSLNGKSLNTYPDPDDIYDDKKSSVDLLDVPEDNNRRIGSPSFGKRLTRKLGSANNNIGAMLQSAVSKQDCEMIRKILSSNVDSGDINFLYPPGVTILHQACVLGDFLIVKLLIKKGADVKLKTWSNLSPIQLAAICGHFDIVQFLLLSGAEVEDVQNGHQVK